MSRHVTSERSIRQRSAGSEEAVGDEGAAAGKLGTRNSSVWLAKEGSEGSIPSSVGLGFRV